MDNNQLSSRMLFLIVNANSQVSLSVLDYHRNLHNSLLRINLQGNVTLIPFLLLVVFK